MRLRTKVLLQRQMVQKQAQQTAERLDRIEIKGFRSLKDVAWEPGRLNVIIGRNGSGKSNFLWGLEFLQESVRGNLREKILAEGGIRQLLWDQKAQNVSWKTDITVQRPGISARSLTYELALRPRGFEGGYYVEHELLADFQKVKAGEKSDPFKLIERSHNHTVIWDSEKHKLVNFPAVTAAADTEGEQVSNLPDDGAALSAVLPYGDILLILYARALGRFRVIHDFDTSRKAPVREAAVARVENTLLPDGRNLVPLLHTLYTGNRDFKRDLDSAMRAAFPHDFESLVFPPAADQKIQLRVQWKKLSNSVSAADLSDGTLRFLMLIAALANPKQGSILAIDEPETGLHPSMFPIVAEFAAAASERTSVILTTHSPQFLDSFPHDCIPTVTVVECVEGETKLTTPPSDELKVWLKDYSLGSMSKSGILETLT